MSLDVIIKAEKNAVDVRTTNLVQLLVKVAEVDVGVVVAMEFCGSLVEVNVAEIEFACGI